MTRQRSFQKVVKRVPVPFRPSEKDPQYLSCYVLETLEYGQEITVYPIDGENFTARTRSCHKCSG